MPMRSPGLPRRYLNGLALAPRGTAGGRPSALPWPSWAPARRCPGDEAGVLPAGAARVIVPRKCRALNRAFVGAVAVRGERVAVAAPRRFRPQLWRRRPFDWSGRRESHVGTGALAKKSATEPQLNLIYGIRHAWPTVFFKRKSRNIRRMKGLMRPSAEPSPERCCIRSRGARGSRCDTGVARSFSEVFSRTMTGPRPRLRPVRQRTYRVLVLSDPLLARSAGLALTRGRYEVRLVTSSAQARSLLADCDPDLLFVDVDMEDGRASELLGVLVRQRRPAAIAVTRRQDPAGKLAAFGLGADDVLIAPFLPEELVARAAAVLRRRYDAEVDLTSAVRLNDLEIDVLARTVRIGDSGRRIDLTPLEHGLLWLLAANAGGVVSRPVIEESLWGSVVETASNVVDQYVHRLRKKLGDDARRPTFIETVGSTGYRFMTRPGGTASVRDDPAS